MPLSQPVTKRQPPRYPINQCAFFKLESRGRLCSLLNITSSELKQLLDPAGRYRVFEQAASVCEFTGKLTKARWVQEPLGDLKRVQARIAKLLGRVEVPEYCHGATKGRSYRSNASAHRDGHCAATFDIKAYFPSTPLSRVYSFFRVDLQCSHDVADSLSRLCSFEGALPTGAPSSPILADFSNRRMFDQLDELARKHGLKFSSYVDDLTFSGKQIPTCLRRLVQLIARHNGHRLSIGKTRYFRSGDPIHITGAVVHGGEVRVPFSRFRKARKITQAYLAATSAEERLRLSRRMAGLLGEAAYLDSRYSGMAQRSYAALAADTKAALPVK